MDLDGVHFDHADRLLLMACRDRGGELQLVLCREGAEDECASAIRGHAQTMVERGYLDRIQISGSRSRMQGAALWATFRARPVALALLDVLERAEALEARLAAQSRRSRSRTECPSRVSTGRSAVKVTSPAENSSSSAR